MKTRVETRFLAWIANCHLAPVCSNWILFNPECSQIPHNTSWYRTVLRGPQWCSGLQNGSLEHGAWVRVPAPPFTKCGYGAYDHGLLSLLSGKNLTQPSPQISNLKWTALAAVILLIYQKGQVLISWAHGGLLEANQALSFLTEPRLGHSAAS